MRNSTVGPCKTDKYQTKRNEWFDISGCTELKMETESDKERERIKSHTIEKNT